MEKHLIEKLAAITEEEERILAGGALDIGEYTAGDTGRKDLTFNAARLTGGTPYISYRLHTRFTPVPLHSHNYVEMVTVIRGEMVNIINGSTVRLTCGDILLMNKHISHSIKEAGREDLAINIIMSDAFFDTLMPHLSGTIFADFAKENSKQDGEGIFLRFSTAGQKQIENIIENILFELTEYTPDNTIMTGTVSLLFKYLSLKHGELITEASDYKSIEQRRRTEISLYISGNYRTANLAQLASELSVSTPYLSKITRDYFGKNFKELVIEERIRRAVEMIEKSDMPIGSIIRSVGYENESYFLREFKKRIGKTPLAMRKSAKKAII